MVSERPNVRTSEHKNSMPAAVISRVHSIPREGNANQSAKVWGGGGGGGGREREREVAREGEIETQKREKKKEKKSGREGERERRGEFLFY